MSETKPRYGSKTKTENPICPKCRAEEFDVSPIGKDSRNGFLVFCTGCGQIVGTLYNPNLRTE